VTPSGHLPSLRVIPTGSITAGTCALLNGRHKMSFRCVCCVRYGIVVYYYYYKPRHVASRRVGLTLTLLSRPWGASAGVLVHAWHADARHSLPALPRLSRTPRPVVRVDDHPILKIQIVVIHTYANVTTNQIILNNREAPVTMKNVKLAIFLVFLVQCHFKWLL